MAASTNIAILKLERELRERTAAAEAIRRQDEQREALEHARLAEIEAAERAEQTKREAVDRELRLAEQRLAAALATAEQERLADLKRAAVAAHPSFLQDAEAEYVEFDKHAVGNRDVRTESRRLLRQTLGFDVPADCWTEFQPGSTEIIDFLGCRLVCHFPADMTGAGTTEAPELYMNPQLPDEGRMGGMYWITSPGQLYAQMTRFPDLRDAINGALAVQDGSDA